MEVGALAVVVGADSECSSEHGDVIEGEASFAVTGFGGACGTLGVMPSYWMFVVLGFVLGFASAPFQSVNTVVV